MIKVHTPRGSVKLDEHERFLLRGILREIRQASYLFEDNSAWTELLELLSVVRAERTYPDECFEIGAEQVSRLVGLSNRTLEHLGADEFRTRTGTEAQEAEALLGQLTAP